MDIFYFYTVYPMKTNAFPSIGDLDFFHVLLFARRGKYACVYILGLCIICRVCVQYCKTKPNRIAIL